MIGRIQEINTAVVIDGGATHGEGRVRVSRIDGKAVDLSSMEVLAPGLKAKRYGIPVDEGLKDLRLSARFFHDERIYFFEASVPVQAVAMALYLPMGAYEAQTGKAWLWVANADDGLRLSDMIEAERKGSEPIEVESEDELWSAFGDPYGIRHGDDRIDAARERIDSSREEEREYRRQQREENP